MNPEHQTSQILTEEKFGRIHTSSVLEEWAGADGPARKALQKEPGNEQAYAWAKKYDLLTLGSSLLVLKPDTGKPKAEGEPAGTMPATAPSLEETVTVSHHRARHSKMFKLYTLLAVTLSGRSLELAVQKKHGKTIPRWSCVLFTEACPSCVKKLPRKVPTAGHQPILTSGFVRVSDPAGRST